MKKVKGLLVVVMVVVSLCGCSQSCKIEGCKNEVYKEGLCQKHYYINEGADAVEGVLNGVMDMIK